MQNMFRLEFWVTTNSLILATVEDLGELSDPQCCVSYFYIDF